MLLAWSFPLLDTIKSALCTTQFSQIDLALLITRQFEVYTWSQKKYFPTSTGREWKAAYLLFSQWHSPLTISPVRQKKHRSGKCFMTSEYRGRNCFIERKVFVFNLKLDKFSVLSLDILTPVQYLLSCFSEVIVLSTIGKWFHIFPFVEIWPTFLAFTGIVLNCFLSSPEEICVLQ